MDRFETDDESEEIHATPIFPINHDIHHEPMKPASNTTGSIVVQEMDGMDLDGVDDVDDEGDVSKVGPMRHGTGMQELDEEEEEEEEEEQEQGEEESMLVEDIGNVEAKVGDRASVADEEGESDEDEDEDEDALLMPTALEQMGASKPVKASTSRNANSSSNSNSNSNSNRKGNVTDKQENGHVGMELDLETAESWMEGTHKNANVKTYANDKRNIDHGGNGVANLGVGKKGVDRRNKAPIVQKNSKDAGDHEDEAAEEQKDNNVKPARGKKKGGAPKKTGAIKAVLNDDDQEDDKEEQEKEERKPSPRKKKAPVAKKGAKPSMEDDEDVEEEEKPAPAKKPKAPASKKRAVKAPAEDDDVDEVEDKPIPAKKAKGPAAKKGAIKPEANEDDAAEEDEKPAKRGASKPRGKEVEEKPSLAKKPTKVATPAVKSPKGPKKQKTTKSAKELQLDDQEPEDKGQKLAKPAKAQSVAKKASPKKPVTAVDSDAETEEPAERQDTENEQEDEDSPVMIPVVAKKSIEKDGGKTKKPKPKPSDEADGSASPTNKGAPLAKKDQKTPAKYPKTPSPKRKKEEDGDDDDHHDTDPSKKKRKGGKDANPYISFSSHVEGLGDALMSACQNFGQYNLLSQLESDDELVFPDVHVVPSSKPGRSLQTLRAIASGAKVVGAEWVFESISAEKWLPFEPYMIKSLSEARERQQKDLLLSGVVIDFVGDIKIHRQQLRELVVECGGKMSKDKCNVLLVGNGKTASVGNRNVAEKVTAEWLWDSILQYKKAGFAKYRVSEGEQKEN